MEVTTLSVSNPPGQPLAQSNLKIRKLEAQINFAFNSTSIKPFSPLVQASFGITGDLQISAVVYLASCESPQLSAVNQESIILNSDKTQLNFFIVYDALEKSNQTFDAYRIDFIVKNPPKDLVQIQTFLWGKESMASGGTITVLN
ncbi:hypothetical protein GCM10022291_22800 [Postechiella marina]|uniref:Uncharacterized protein n=1 Tax=Postechiella marina TaxID=943941 RepID=A0ABP8CBH3_9FLAO